MINLPTSVMSFVFSYSLCERERESWRLNKMVSLIMHRYHVFIILNHNFQAGVSHPDKKRLIKNSVFMAKPIMKYPLIY